MLSLNDFLVCLRWYGVLFMLGFFAWGLSRRYFEEMSDKGYAVSKVVGLVGLSTVSWVLSTLHILPFNALTLWLFIGLSGVCLFKTRHGLLKDIKLSAKKLFLIECLSIMLFFGAVAIRSSNPKIEGIEKYMDSGILQSVLRTEKGVPEDQYYAGSTINYYYFGHYMVGTVAKVSNTKGAEAFNLGFATVISLAGLAIFAIAYHLSANIFGGLLALFLALFLSNLHPFFALVRQVPEYAFFNSGRFVDYAINEYPLYSVSLGDLHAHFIGLLLTVLCLYLSMVYVLQKKAKQSLPFFIGTIIGLMGATNAFDVISMSFVVGGALIFRFLTKELKNIKGSFIMSLKTSLVLSFKKSYSTNFNQVSLARSLALCAFGVFLPLVLFLRTFVSPDGGIGISIWKTPTTHILTQFGGFMALLFCSGVVALFIRNKKNKKSLSFVQWLMQLDQKNMLVWLCIFVGILLILLPQIGYLKDIYFYQNPPYYRANTQFKIWYSAWIVLSLGTGASVGLILRKVVMRPFVAGIYLAFVLSVISVLAIGTFRGLQTVTDELPSTINGISFLAENEPDKLALVEWANNNITGQHTIIEAVGDSYSRLNWFSSYTGLPTVIGWRSHEWGWRYSANQWTEIANRQNSVESIYKNTSATEMRKRARDLLVEYIVLGPDEYSSYNSDKSLFDAAFGSAVYVSGEYNLYKVTE